ncbi:hypothetical protein GBF38_000200, partial [Nibea albiflora]
LTISLEHDYQQQPDVQGTIQGSTAFLYFSLFIVMIRLRGGLVTSQKGEQYGRNTAHSVTSRGIHSGEPRHHLTSLTVSDTQISATNLALSAGSQADRSGPGEGDWPSETDQICLTSTSVLSRREDPLRGPRSCHLEVQQTQINRKHPKFRELIQIRLRGGLVTSQKGEQYGRNTAHSVTSRGIHSGEPRHHLTSLTVSDTRKKRTQETTQIV